MSRLIPIPGGPARAAARKQFVPRKKQTDDRPDAEFLLILDEDALSGEQAEAVAELLGENKETNAALDNLDAGKLKQPESD